MLFISRLFPRLLIILFVAFVLHRGLSFEFLAPQGFSVSNADRVSFLFVGLLSDFWVATLIAWLAVLLTWATCSVGRAKIYQKHVASGVAVIFIVLTALHQPYVEFFHFQFLPVHLQYLSDLDFIAANGSSAWSTSAMLIFVVAILLSAILLIPLNAAVASRKRIVIYGIAVALSSTALLAHMINIRTRVQWFVPELLRTNYLENFYIAYGQNYAPPPLSSEEIMSLALQSGLLLKSAVQPDVEQLRAELALRPPVESAGHERLAQVMREDLRRQRLAKRKPLVLVLLLESMRPSESALYGGTKPTLTPEIDQLARTGIWFAQAYSTGNVTRGGQEAAWCGYYSTQSNSAMRNRPDIHLRCLPDIIAEHRLDIATAWYHGGRGEFDGQQPFWAKHGVERFLVDANFPPETPRTGWGVSDLAFYDRVLGELAGFKASAAASGQTAFLGMLLTVSNHIPWRMPADASADLRKTVAGLSDPSHATAVYADAAIGVFVERLKQQQLWDETLLVLMSDHGHGAPSYQDLPPHRHRLHQAVSHIHLLISGGIGERAARTLPQEVGKVRERLVSQADLAPFLAYVLDLKDMRFFSEGLFVREPRQTMVIADTGAGVYLPASQKFYSYAELAKGGTRLAPNDLQLRRYINFLNYINTTRTLPGGLPHVE